MIFLVSVVGGLNTNQRLNTNYGVNSLEKELINNATIRPNQVLEEFR